MRLSSLCLDVLLGAVWRNGMPRRLPNVVRLCRRLLLVPKDLQWEMKRYDDPTRHLVNTDIDDLLDIEDAKMAKEAAESKKKREEQEAAAGAATPAPADPAGGEGKGKGEGGEKEAPTAMDVDGPTPPDVKVGGAPSAPVGESRGRYHALCLHFTLPTAAYATMCLREITHQDTSTIFHTSLNCLEPGQHPAAAAAKGSAVAADAGAGAGGGEAKAEAPAPKGAVIKVGSSLK